jgi:capsid protein
MVSILMSRKGKLFFKNLGGTYDGEKMKGDLDGWTPFDDDPNDFLVGKYDLLARRSTTLYHTYPPLIGAVDKQTDYAIGDGLFFRSQPDYELIGVTKEWARDWGRKFQKLVHAEFSQLNFYGKQQALFRSALIGGDSLLYFIRERDQFDLVEYSGNNAIDSSANENGITLGIIHDTFHRRLGFINHNGERVLFRDKNGRCNAVIFYIKRLSRQLRGYPLSYSIISLAKNDDRHNDATVKAAIMEAIIPVFTESPNPVGTSAVVNNLGGSIRRKGPIGQALEKLGVAGIGEVLPGNILNFPSGGKITSIDKKTPSATYAAYKEWVLNYIGMATGTPPEVIIGKYSTSYTAHKGALNDFIKSYMSKRYAFIESVCYPVLEEVTTNLILEGMIEAPGFLNGSGYVKRAYLNGIWLGPIPGHINPVQEMNAKIAAVEAGFSLRGDEAFTISGSDFDAMMSEWHRQEVLFSGTSESEKAELIKQTDKKEENT